jgi:hypothetical protein
MAALAAVGLTPNTSQHNFRRAQVICKTRSELLLSGKIIGVLWLLRVGRDQGPGPHINVQIQNVDTSRTNSIFIESYQTFYLVQLHSIDVLSCFTRGEMTWAMID